MSSQRIEESNRSQAPKIGAVVHIGAWPPPLGGVTAYVRRLSLLLRDRGWRVTVIDVSGHRKAFPQGVDGIVLQGTRLWQTVGIAWRIARLPRDTLVHIHVSSFRSVSALLRLLPWLFCLRRVIVSIYDGRFTDWAKQLTLGRRETLRQVLAAAEVVVVVSDEQRRAVIDHIRIPSERVCLIPAFLHERRPDSATVPDLPSGEAPLVLVSGVGEPLYWWEGVLDAAERIGPKLRWALTSYTRFDPGYFDEIERRATALPNVALFRNLATPPFQSLLAQCDLYVRPTLTDGDSITLREALAAGKSVIASDAVRRPPGVRLFRSQDVDDLIRALEDAAEQGTVSSPPERADFSEEILSVYAKVARR